MLLQRVTGWEYSQCTVHCVTGPSVILSNSGHPSLLEMSRRCTSFKLVFFFLVGALFRESTLHTRLPSEFRKTCASVCVRTSPPYPSRGENNNAIITTKSTWLSLLFFRMSIQRKSCSLSQYKYADMTCAEYIRGSLALHCTAGRTPLPSSAIDNAFRAIITMKQRLTTTDLYPFRPLRVRVFGIDVLVFHELASIDFHPFPSSSSLLSVCS